MSAFVTIIGNLGADPELKFTEKGTRCNVRVAVNQGKDSTAWYSASIFGSRGETLHNSSLRKGSTIAVFGRLVTNEKDGKTYLNINSADWAFCGPKRQTDEDGFADPDGIPF